MSENTKIEWADATVNFWAGCTKISPACDNCYAEKMAKRLWGVQWGPGKPRKQFFGSADTLVKLDRKAKREGAKPLVFINSLSDLFDNEVDDADRADAFEAMSLCTELVFLVLTKRIGNVAPYLTRDAIAAEMFASGRAYLGATICNQPEADRDIVKLMAVRARVRFLSVEPMLGPVDLTRYSPSIFAASANALTGQWKWQNGPKKQETPPLDWVIVGGESGPGARPMHPDWARSLRDQCQAAGTPFLFKQWGDWKPISQMPGNESRQWYVSKVKAEPHESQAEIDDCYGKRCTVPFTVVHPDGSTHDFLAPGAWTEGAMQTFRIGKKAAGRLLDGVEHNGFPVGAAAA